MWRSHFLLLCVPVERVHNPFVRGGRDRYTRRKLMNADSHSYFAVCDSFRHTTPGSVYVSQPGAVAALIEQAAKGVQTAGA
jgi:hypothetical protein